jgi:hypothetical protein
VLSNLPERVLDVSGLLNWAQAPRNSEVAFPSGSCRSVSSADTGARHHPGHIDICRKPRRSRGLVFARTVRRIDIGRDGTRGGVDDRARTTVRLHGGEEGRIHVRPELRIAQNSVGSRESARAFKGIIWDDISEFESYMPSHAVRSPPPRIQDSQKARWRKLKRQARRKRRPT